MAQAVMSDSEHARISQAVHEAELHTSGEIVTIIADHSDSYADVALWWASGIAIFALGWVTVFSDFYTGMVSDLLGSPLPSDLVQAKKMEQISVAWRSWLGMRVKIIDEYNRIPTRTQSALLTVMADNYAEVFDQTFECPEAAWYLTANDDAGGGTYQVIEALKDRIDIVVKALHFNSRFLGDLLGRIEEGIKPEEVVPPQIIFTEDEGDRMHKEILAIPVPPPILRRIEFFASQFEFCEPAGDQIAEQRAHHAAGFRGALAQAQDVLVALGIDHHLARLVGAPRPRAVRAL